MKPPPTTAEQQAELNRRLDAIAALQAHVKEAIKTCETTIGSLSGTGYSTNTADIAA